MNFLYSFYFFLFFLCENTEHFSTYTQAHNMEIDLKTMTSEKDALNVELSSLRRELGGSAGDLSDQQNRLRVLEDELQQTRTRSFKESTKHKHQAASLAETMRKLQNQLEQTRALLETVQQQREGLKDSNQELRNELDMLYKQKANGRL